MRKFSCATLLLCVLSFAAALPVAATEYSVYMESYGFFGFRFRPNYIEIEVGDSIQWINEDYTEMGYSGYDCEVYYGSTPVWYSGAIYPGESIAVTFPYAGTFNCKDTYYGTYGMTATVVVKEPAPGNTGPILVDPQWLSNGQFQCTVSNLVVGTTNVVFASQDPSASAASWTLLSSNIVASTTEVFTDTNTTAFPARFYRAFRP